MYTDHPFLEALARSEADYEDWGRWMLGREIARSFTVGTVSEIRAALALLSREPEATRALLLP